MRIWAATLVLLVGCGGPADDDGATSQSDDTVADLPPDDGDGRVVSVAHYGTTCALTESGRVRCWGLGDSLGVPGESSLGVDGDTVADAPFLELGGRATQLINTGHFACALLEGGDVRCWGSNAGGILGLGSTENAIVGDDEHPRDVPFVDIGGRALELAGYGRKACALREDGAVLCWGRNEPTDPLGYPGHPGWVGDDERPADVGPIDLPGAAVGLALAIDKQCALLENSDVYCWGASHLGYPNAEPIGDNEAPSTAGPVSLPGTPVHLFGAGEFVCALLEDGSLSCWGLGAPNILGPNLNSVGGFEGTSPSDVEPISFAEPAVAVTGSGGGHLCALTESGAVHCWGCTAAPGQLGMPEVASGECIGLGGTYSDHSAVDVGEPVAAISHHSAGSTFVVTHDGKIIAWGQNPLGSLGYGHDETIGDDEVPASAGYLPW